MVKQQKSDLQREQERELKKAQQKADKKRQQKRLDKITRRISQEQFQIEHGYSYNFYIESVNYARQIAKRKGLQDETDYGKALLNLKPSVVRDYNQRFPGKRPSSRAMGLFLVKLRFPKVKGINSRNPDIEPWTKSDKTFYLYLNSPATYQR